MAEVASAFVSLVPTTKGFGKQAEAQLGAPLEKAGKSGGRRFGGSMASGFLPAAKGLIGPLAGIFAVSAATNFLKGSIAEARESQKVGALTAQVIKTTGGAAKVTAGQVGDLATAISNKTGIDDEAIQSASNLLLTFTNVRNEVGKGNDIFNQATQAATDMGAALGTEPKAAAIQLGKALNDPIKGVTALSRVGVSFTAQQKKQIKTLVDSGDTLGAQKIILAELNKEFGGAAAASATAGEKFATTFGNFKEAIGTALLPIIDKILGASSKFVSYLTANMGPAFAKVGGFIKPVTDAVQVFIAAFKGGAVLRGGFLADIGKAAYRARAAFDAIVEGVKVFIEALRGGEVTAVGGLGKVGDVAYRLRDIFLGQVVPAIRAFAGFIVTQVVPILVSLGQIVVTKIVPAFLAVARFLYGTVYPALLTIVLAVATRLSPVLSALTAVVKSRVIPVIQLVAAKFQAWWPTIKTVVMFVVSLIGWVLKLAASILGKVLPIVIRLAGFLLTVLVKSIIWVIEAIAKVIGWLIKFGAGVVAVVRKFLEFERGVRSVVQRVVQFFIDLPGKIVNAVGNVDDLLLNAGRRIIDGLLRGITEGFQRVKDKLGELTDNLPGWKGPPARDSVILRDAGRLVIGGFIGGMESQYSDVRNSLQGLTGNLSQPKFAGVAGLDAAAGVTRLHPHDIVLLADAIAARPTVLDGQRVSKSQDHALAMGVRL